VQFHLSISHKHGKAACTADGRGNVLAKGKGEEALFPENRLCFL